MSGVFVCEARPRPASCRYLSPLAYRPCWWSALFCVDRLDNRSNTLELASSLFHARQRVRSSQTPPDSGIFKISDTLDCYVTNTTTGAFEQASLGIKFSSVIEADVYVPGIYGDVAHAVFQSFGRSVAESDGVISVVHRFNAGRHLLQYQCAGGQRQFPNRLIKGLQEFKQRLGRRVRHGRT